MNEAKHTPAPWHMSISGPTVYALHGEPLRNRFTAHVQAGRSDDASYEELLANARLMVAAPELLEVARDVDAAYESINRNHPQLTQEHPAMQLWAKARAAIAKATGAAQ